jgi:hypothetical protein
MNSLLSGISGEHTNSRFFRLVTILAILLLAGATTSAYADCGMPKQMLAASASKAASNTSFAVSSLQQPISSSNSQVSGVGQGKEPIVGLWRILLTDDSGNIVDRVISGWTSDGLEFDQDISPMLTGYVCYGTWVKLGHNAGVTEREIVMAFPLDPAGISPRMLPGYGRHLAFASPGRTAYFNLSETFRGLICAIWVLDFRRS